MHQQQSLIEPFHRYDNFLEGPNVTRKAPDARVVQAEFSFGPFRLVPHARLLEREGLPTSLGSRAFDLLCLLASRPGEVVSKADLIANAWPGLTVDECNLRLQITNVRRALGDNHGSERYVVNVPGRGYCFVARVEPVLPRHTRRKIG